MSQLAADTLGIWRVLGPTHAARWLLAIADNWRVIARERNLQRADLAMGPGPFLVRTRSARESFQVAGEAAFSGIREIYVRDCYLRGGELSIADGDVVFDFGANMGNFTNLALAHGRHVRVVAVEPNGLLEERFWASVAVNEGFRERIRFVRAFLGSPGSKQREMESTGLYRGSPFLTEDDVLRMTGVSRVNFLKCDIEGGEFSFFSQHSPLLAMTDQLAIEVHAFGGDVDEFVSRLPSVGLKIRHLKEDPDGTCTVVARRER